MSSRVMTTDMAGLLPYILPKVPTAPNFLVEFQARNAVIEFCERTRCWRQLITTSVGSDGKARVTPLGVTIHEIEEAYLDDTLLEPTQFTGLEPDELTGQTTKAQAKYISQINPGEVIVFPKETGTLRISCFLKPKQGMDIGSDPSNPLADANNIMPEFMLTQYAEKLAAGALYRIMSIPKQDFTDMKSAAVHKAEFDAACDSHFSTSIKGQQRTPLRTKARFI